jgi:hypothetical protein
VIEPMRNLVSILFATSCHAAECAHLLKLVIGGPVWIAVGWSAVGPQVRAVVVLLRGMVQRARDNGAARMPAAWIGGRCSGTAVSRRCGCV